MRLSRKGKPVGSRVRVMGSSGSSNNSFVDLMNEALVRVGHVEHRPYSPVLALSVWPEIWHFNWPERTYQSANLFLAFLRAVKLIAQIRLARLRGTKIAWTVHNLMPHEIRNPLLESWFWKNFRRNVDLFIHLSAAGGRVFRLKHPDLASRAHVHLRHPAYPSAESTTMDKAEARRLLGIGLDEVVYAFPGMLRAYKNVPETIQVFRGIQDRASQLIVAGHVPTDELKEEIVGAAGDDDRISLRFGFLETEELNQLITAADLVVLPYEGFLNSGLLMLSLSLHSPVLVPSTPVTQEISDEVGNGWVYTFEGTLSSSVMSNVGDRVRGSTFGQPDLSKYNWELFGRELGEAFRHMVHGT